MGAVTVINPSSIQSGDAQNIIVDLQKFDYAKEQVGLVVNQLTPFLVINTEEAQTEALKLLVVAKDVEKAIEEKRKLLVKPFNEGASKINEYKRELVSGLTDSIGKVKNAVLEYQTQKEKQALQLRVTARQGELTELGFSFNPSTNRHEFEKIGSVSNVEIEHYDDAGWVHIINGYVNAINNLKSQVLAGLNNEKEFIKAFGSDEDKLQLNQKINSVSTHVAKPSNGSSYVAPATKVKGQTKTWTFTITDINAVPREYLMVDQTLIREAIKNGNRSIPGISIYQKDGLTIR